MSLSFDQPLGFVCETINFLLTEIEVGTTYICAEIPNNKFQIPMKYGTKIRGNWNLVLGIWNLRKHL